MVKQVVALWPMQNHARADVYTAAGRRPYATEYGHGLKEAAGIQIPHRSRFLAGSAACWERMQE